MSNITIHIPISENTSYSLFAQGLLLNIPEENESKESIILRFPGENVVALFYSFGNFRRAYLVTKNNTLTDEKIFLPGTTEPLNVLLKVKGRKIDKLKHCLYILTKEDKYAPFRLPIEFWGEISRLIEYSESTREEIFYIYKKYIA